MMSYLLFLPIYQFISLGEPSDLNPNFSKLWRILSVISWMVCEELKKLIVVPRVRIYAERMSYHPELISFILIFLLLLFCFSVLDCYTRK